MMHRKINEKQIKQNNMLKLLCCAFVTKYVLTRTLYFFVQVSFIVYREVTKTLQDLPVIFINPFWDQCSTYG